MQDGLIKKIRQEIEKRGFPVELKVASIFDKEGYRLNYKYHYFDEDEGKYRHTNLRALKEKKFKIDEEFFSVKNCLLVECVKSKRPWIILSTPIDSNDPDPIMVPYLPKVSFINMMEYQHTLTIHPFAKYQHKGRNYYQSYRDLDDEGEERKESSDAVFNAVFSAVKSLQYLTRKSFGAGAQSVCFYYPLIIFEGRLLQAYWDNGKVNVEEVSSVIISFHLEAGKHQFNRFTVPILKEAELPNFLCDLDNILLYYAELAQKRPNLAFPKAATSIQAPVPPK